MASTLTLFTSACVEESEDLLPLRSSCFELHEEAAEATATLLLEITDELIDQQCDREPTRGLVNERLAVAAMIPDNDAEVETLAMAVHRLNDSDPDVTIFDDGFRHGASCDESGCTIIIVGGGGGPCSQVTVGGTTFVVCMPE